MKAEITIKLKVKNKKELEKLYNLAYKHFNKNRPSEYEAFLRANTKEYSICV